MSPAEEWKRLQDPEKSGRVITLPSNIAHAVLQAASHDELNSRLSSIRQRTAGRCDGDETTTDEDPHTTVRENGDKSTGGVEDEDRPVERLLVSWNNGFFSTFPAPSEVARRLLTSGLISLNLSGNELVDDGLGNIALSWTPWLRELNVAREAGNVGLKYGAR